MRFGLGPRLFLGILLVLFMGQGVSARFVDKNVQSRTKVQIEERLTYEVIMLGQMTANALFGPIEPGDTSLSGVVEQLARVVHTNLSILAPDGTVVADSDIADVSKLAKEAAAPEIVEAVAHETGVAVRESRMFVARSIVRDGKLLGIARASVPMAFVSAAAYAARMQMAYGGALVAAIAIVVAAFIALGILRPIKALSVGAQKIGAGDLAHRIAVASNDEIGDLGRTLNEMVRRLQLMVGTLDQRNKDMRVVLDNVAQGLVTVDREGTIAAERSTAIDRWFSSPKAGAKIWELFESANSQVRVELSIGWEQLFEGFLPLELSLSQLPRRIRCGQHTFELGCEPVMMDDGQLDKCLVVISDVTHIVAAEQTELEQREQLALFGAVAKDREGVVDFLKATGDIVDQALAYGDKAEHTVDVKRAIHTVKGNCGLFGLTSLSTLCHEIETRIAETEQCGPGGQPPLLATEADQLSQVWILLMERANDLLGNLSSNALKVTPRDVAQLVFAIQQGKSPEALVRSIATWSLEPVEARLQRLAQQARQLAERMGKPGVTVDIQPSSVRLPSDQWAPFWGNVSHVIRNALDHGIESEEERKLARKPEHGRLRLSALEVGGHVVVAIEDDGRGINWTKVREKARKAGLPSSSEGDLVEALFSDGVSTRDEVSELSGRGVGLSAVRAACISMNGRIEVDSSIGMGTTLRFLFPLPGTGETFAKTQASASSAPHRFASVRPRVLDVPSLRPVPCGHP